jgi:hypothetical protein
MQEAARCSPTFLLWNKSGVVERRETAMIYDLWEERDGGTGAVTVDKHAKNSKPSVFWLGLLLHEGYKSTNSSQGQSNKNLQDNLERG